MHARQYFDVLLGHAAALTVVNRLGDVAGTWHAIHDDTDRTFRHAVDPRHRQIVEAE